MAWGIVTRETSRRFALKSFKKLGGAVLNNLTHATR
jgi:hypothetical protein